MPWQLGLPSGELNEFRMFFRRCCPEPQHPRRSQPLSAVPGALCWRTSPGSGDDTRSDPRVRKGLKYCGLMRGGVGRAQCSRLRFLRAALGSSSGGWMLSAAGERGKCLGRDFAEFLRHPWPSAGFLNLVASFLLMGMG